MVLAKICRVLCLGGCLVVAAACAHGGDWAGDSAAAQTVHVFSNGWHTDVIIERAALPTDQLPEAADFPGQRYLMLGWGDADYYMTADPSLWQMVKAALWPTPAVMHVVGLSRPPSEVFPTADIRTIRLKPDAFVRLVAQLHESFVRDGTAKAASLAPGLYDNSLFYEAHGRFHLFNMCNSWTVRILAAAGLPLSDFGIITADSVILRLDRLLADQPPM